MTRKKPDIYYRLVAQKNASNVDYGHSRHKCSACGRVRNEDKMKKWTYVTYGGNLKVHKTRFQNECWHCADNPACLEKLE